MPAVEICILAGGLSRRMGRDKSRLRLRGKTLLRRVRDIAEKTGLPARVIRRDLVPRCGPLGGVQTALQTTKADTVLFLACDMPFITPEMIRKIARFSSQKRGVVFTRHGPALIGFPFLLRREHLKIVVLQLKNRRFSIQLLARRCRAKSFSPPFAKWRLFNVNTPDDWARARKLPV